MFRHSRTGGLVILYIAYGFETPLVQGFGAQAWPWGEIVYDEECMNIAFCTAIALRPIHPFQNHCIVFSPAHPYT